MSFKAWQLPWRGELVPHAVLDIIRECNISCRACYNTDSPEKSKSLAQIQAELETLLQMRRLSSVSILGGEVTLHPELEEVIRLVKGKGLGAELISNGLGVDDKVCRKYKETGLDIIYFHIERAQERPDLKDNQSAADIKKLRQEKARIAGEAGLDVGLTVTVFPGEADDLMETLRVVLETEEVNYLLVTLYRDHSNVENLTGDVLSGFNGQGKSPDSASKQNNVELAAKIKQELGFDPFCFMGSNVDLQDPRWMSYLIGTVYQEDGSFKAESIQPSLLEKFFMFLYRMKGKYPMYMRQDPERFQKQLFLNGLLGGRRSGNRVLIKESEKSGTKLRAKRLLFQNPAEMTDEGGLIHCKWCPDAVLKNGVLVPVCITDQVS